MQLFFCKSKTLNSQYLGPKTVMNMCTSGGEDSGTVLHYYIDQSLSADTNSSFTNALEFEKFVPALSDWSM